MRKSGVLILLIMSLMGGVSVFGQDSTEAKIKAMFMYNFTKYIHWENEDEIPEFRIGIIGDMSEMERALLRIVDKKTFYGKRFILQPFNSVEELSPVNMLLVVDPEKYAIDQIWDKIKGESTLLITEGYPFEKTMISFVEQNERMKFELNEKNIKVEGMTVDERLKDLAVPHE